MKNSYSLSLANKQAKFKSTGARLLAPQWPLVASLLSLGLTSRSIFQAVLAQRGGPLRQPSGLGWITPATFGVYLSQAKKELGH